MVFERGGVYFQLQWADRIKQYKAIRAKGQCVIWQKGRRLQLVCAYNPKFVQAATSLSGNWRDKSGIWSFRVQSYGLVKAQAIKYFGQDNVIVQGSIQGGINA